MGMGLTTTDSVGPGWLWAFTHCLHAGSLLGASLHISKQLRGPDVVFIIGGDVKAQNTVLGASEKWT